ncbi:lysine--tRNA ligase [Candidatus Bathyarchaeota archaeon]|nr:lysine--tRNA ligase [Candidatus Bathyarchaeota archaeon]
MSRQIIGRGTWLDLVAQRVLEREDQLGRKPTVIRTESGLGASGIPHVGSLGDGVRSYAIKLAIESLGRKAEYIAFSDDMDGLRKVPTGMPASLATYLSYPVTSIPDPFNCHGSYGDHMSSLLREALDRCGVEYTFLSATKAYREGLYNNQILKILENADRVAKIIKEELGQEKYTEVLPYFPICGGCGRIYTTRAYKYLPEEHKVLYSCEGQVEIRGQELEGCGFRGEVDVLSGLGKLSWKSEFAARWEALEINFEAYGKDIMDSVRVNDRICQDVLGYAPPYHIRYEMFLDKSGKKISKSVGNILTPQIWLRYASPESLILLMLKRIVGARTLSVDDIPTYMTELDKLEDIYFGKKVVEDKNELVGLKGLYEYVWRLRPPERPDAHIPYNLLVYLAKIAPKGKENEYALSKLEEYGYLRGDRQQDIDARLRYARNWAEDFTEITEHIPTLSGPEANAVRELLGIIRGPTSVDALQNSIFEVAKKNGIDPPEFFRMLYGMLLGSPRGPRLGPYIEAMGRENVADALERAVTSASTDQSGDTPKTT